MARKIWKVEYVDYLDVNKEAELGLWEDAVQFTEDPADYEEIRAEYYRDAQQKMKQIAYVEGNTRKGMISNLKNILYNCHLEILTAVPVM